MAHVVGPFERHLRDAIALNRERASLYAALSKGASAPISRTLIAAERFLLPVAHWFDGRAAPYHKEGIPLLESLFVPMSGAPPFVPARPLAGRRGDQPAPRPGAIGRRIRAAYDAGSFAGAARALEGEVDALAGSESDFLLRHLLESARRLAQLAPGHIALARERGLRSPAPLLARLLRLHLWGLAPAHVLDERAHPLHARGIAILAQDLPVIPPAHD